MRTSHARPTRTWHASLSLRLPGGACGGKLRRADSVAVHSPGETASSGPRICTAHVPHVPRPRQLITLALPLCGVSPARNSAVRSFEPARTVVGRPRNTSSSASAVSEVSTSRSPDARGDRGRVGPTGLRQNPTRAGPRGVTRATARVSMLRVRSSASACRASECLNVFTKKKYSRGFVEPVKPSNRRREKPAAVAPFGRTLSLTLNPPLPHL